MTTEPEPQDVGPRRPFGACELCWTNSWEPVESEADCVVSVHPHEVDHVRCGYCWLEGKAARWAEREQQLVEALTAAADSLEEVEGHVGAYLWEKHGYADDIAQARAVLNQERPA